MNILRSGESGQALIISLILLAMCGLLMVPMLQLASTNLKYHQLIQRNTEKTYAADSGVEYALGKLGNNPEHYKLNTLDDNFVVDNRTVDVTMEYVNNHVYRITSIAVTDANSSTSVESLVCIITQLFVY